MQRDVLDRILRASSSLKVSGQSFEVLEGHELTVYVAQGATVTTIQDIRTGKLDDAFIELAARDRRTLYVPYDVVQYVAVRQDGKRAGFL